MTRNMGSVLRLSIIGRNLIKIPNRALSLRLLQSSTIFEKKPDECLNFKNREFSRFKGSEQPHRSIKQGPINEDLKKCQTFEEVLKLIDEEGPQMNGSTAVKCLSHLYEIGSSEKSTLKKIYHMREFEVLCNSLQRDMQKLTAGEAIDTLRFLTICHVPTSSTIIQSVLQVIRKKLHELSLETSTFLLCLLSRCQKNPTVDSMALALHIVLESHLSVNSRSVSINSLTNCLKHLRNSDVPVSIHGKIIRAIGEISSSDIAPGQAKIIVFCLLDMKVEEHMKTLFPKMLQILAEDIDCMSKGELLAMILRITKVNRLKPRNDNFFYNHDFVETVVNFVISRNLDFVTSINILNFLAEMDHVNISILDYIAKFFENGKVPEDANSFNMSRIMSSCSFANYKPYSWETIKETLIGMNVKELIPKRRTKMALHAAALDLHWPKLYSEVLTKFRVNGKELKKKKNFLLLYHTIKRNFPEYDGPWPTKEVLDACADASVLVEDNFLLKSAIETVLGGPQYVLNNMKTRLGDPIDHVVIMRKGGYPIAINNNPEDSIPKIVEDLQLLPDSQALLFTCLPEYACPRNSDNLTGIWVLIQKLIEAETNHSLIAIPAAKWNRMSNSEQIRYISQAIRAKCNELSQLVVNAEATEDVINNENNGFMGCDDTSNHPTCGQMYYKGVKIPYSQGFCCSCETESTQQREFNDTTYLLEPQFHRKTFKDDTKSIVNILENLNSHKTYSTSLLDPSVATKYTKFNKIPSKDPQIQWNTVNFNRIIELNGKNDVSIDKTLKKSSSNPRITNNSSISTYSDIKKEILRELKKFSLKNRKKKRSNKERREWKKNHLNKIRELLMKSRIGNNEKYLNNSDYSGVFNNIETIHTSKVMNFLNPNISTTVNYQYLPQNPQNLRKMKLHEVKMEKTTIQPTLNWKIPIEDGNSFISGNKDFRYLEKELKALADITKQTETTVKAQEVTYKPRIIVDRFQIKKKRETKKNRYFMKRKLQNYIENDEKSSIGRKFISNFRQLLNRKSHNHLRSDNTFPAKKQIKSENSEDFSAKDYVISLTGKVHINGGEDDSPISITFDNPSDFPDKTHEFPNFPRINRRSVEKLQNPREIILKSNRNRFPNKQIRSDSPKTSKILEKNLISNEMPQTDQNSIEIITTIPGKIKPHSSDNKLISEFPPISQKSPENLVHSSENPINLKIIGLISMSNPSAIKIGPNSPKKVDKTCLGDFKIVPMIQFQVDKQFSVPQSQEKNEKTTIKPACPFASKTTVQLPTPVYISHKNTESPDDIMETVTFFVDSGDDDSTEMMRDEKIELKTNSPEDYSILTPQAINQTGLNAGLNDEDNLDEKIEKEDYSPDDKDVQLKKMLAVMEFIKKLKKILNGDDGNSDDEGDTIIRLQKFIIKPENSSDSSIKKAKNAENYENSIDISDESVKTTQKNQFFISEHSTIADFDNLSEIKASQENLKQIHTNEMIKEPKNGDKQKLEETLRRKLIDRYLDKEKDSRLNRVSEISRDLSTSLNSLNAFDNTHEVRRTREIGNSGLRLRRKESTKKKKKKKRKGKKKRKKKKKMKGKKFENQQKGNKRNSLPFRRQLMSLKINDFNKKNKKINDFHRRYIYNDNIGRKNEKYFVINEEEKIERKKRDNTEKLKDQMVIKKEDYINSSVFHIRGGQNCMDLRHPKNVNSAKYLESAHCLRFSDLWYSVYKLEKPVIDHTVYVQFFKRNRKTSKWQDLTRGEMIRLGTFTRHQRDEIPTIVFTYIVKNLKIQEFSLNSNSQRLLIPLTESIKKQHSEKKEKKPDGINEYLIIPKNQITSQGHECDKAGVGFFAFFMEKNRCKRKRGSCLRNQPLSYWRHDMDARHSGLPGCYFLSNFATVPVNPIKYNVTDVTGREMYLGLVQNTHHVSTLGIEVRADDNDVIRTGLSARITEVHVDATAEEKINLSIRLTNTGLVSSYYQARIVKCPLELSKFWDHPITQKYLVPPQHDSILTFHLDGKIVADNFECRVEVINYRGELVAARRIIVQKMNRCFCLWHCTCTCTSKSSHGFSCATMTPEHYHEAGFKGSVPIINTRISEFFQIFVDILLVILTIFIIFLILGLVKWIFGIIYAPIGRWGLDSLLYGFKIEEYLEPELKCRCVITDNEKIPIHPDTGRRTVRICNKMQEFFFNTLFFFAYPSAVICHCMRKLRRCRKDQCRCDDSKNSLIQKEGPRVITVKSYGGTRNSKLEQDDTEYVIKELNKSQLSLQGLSEKSMKKTT